MTKAGGSRGRTSLSGAQMLGAAATFALAASVAHARDANRVHRLLVGRGAALAAAAGLDASNDYRSRSSFPQNPELAFRTRLSGGIGQPPESDTDGNLIIVHSEPRLSKLDAKGHLLWSGRLPGEAACAPVLTSDGSILVVTRDAEALLFSAAGKVEVTRTLPILDPKRRTTMIPTSSGGALLAYGREVLELDRAARLIRQTRARGSVTALAESGTNLVLVGENGTVELARESGDFELVGSFGGSVPDGAAVQGGKVWAVVDAHQWLALELSSGKVETLVMDSTLTLAGPAALLASGAAALLADDAFVSLRAPNGVELSRSALSAPNLPFDHERGARHAHLLSDSQGAIAAVQGGSDALVIGTDGRLARLDGTSCLDPYRPTPTRSGLVLSCRSGQLFGIADKER